MPKIKKKTKDSLGESIVEEAKSLQVDNKKNFNMAQLLLILRRKSILKNGALLREKCIELEKEGLMLNIGGPVWRAL